MENSEGKTAEDSTKQEEIIIPENLKNDIPGMDELAASLIKSNPDKTKKVEPIEDKTQIADDKTNADDKSKGEPKVIHIDKDKEALSKLGYNEEEIAAFKPEDVKDIIKKKIEKVDVFDDMPDADKEFFKSQKAKVKKGAKTEQAKLDDKGQPIVDAAKSKVEVPADYETFKTSATEYEALKNDDMTKAFIEWRKNGGTDLNEFNTKLGFTDANKLSAEDLFKHQAIEAGVEKEDLEDAVSEAMAKYEDMTKIEKAQALKTMRTELSSKNKVDFKKFEFPANKNVEADKEQRNKINEKAISDIGKIVTDKTGKIFNNTIAIDEPMAKMIDNTARAIAGYYGKQEKDGKVIGFDIKEAHINKAIWAEFGEEILATALDKQLTHITDKYYLQRRRISDETSSAVADITKKPDIKKAFGEIGEIVEKQMSS